MGTMRKLLCLSAIFTVLMSVQGYPPGSSNRKELTELRTLKKLLDVIRENDEEIEELFRKSGPENGDENQQGDEKEETENGNKNEDGPHSHADELDQEALDLESETAKLVVSMERCVNGNIKKDTKVKMPQRGVEPTDGNEQRLTAEQEELMGLTHSQSYFPLLKNNVQDITLFLLKGTRRKRNFLKSAWRWPKGIVPFEIDTSSIVKNSSYNVIQRAAEAFNNLTCVKWLPRSENLTEEVGHDNYVSFYSGSGCWSYVGYLGRSSQYISLAEWGCMSVSTACHEMLHAMGIMHEQSRADRDDYITINWENIKDGKSNGNFGKSNTYDKNPYDYQSVMQYGLWAFSNTGGQVFELKDKELEFLVGTTYSIDFYDVMDVTTNYGCADHCIDPPRCENGGFVNHNCECYCPKGLTGSRCESPITDSGCGGVVELALGKTQYLTSPNYPDPYPTGKLCKWLVKASEGLYVRATVLDFHLPSNSLNRCYHWLEVQYNLPGQTGIRFCGDIVGRTFTTSRDSNDMMILTFDSEFVNNRAQEKGFKISLSAVGRGCKNNPCMYGRCEESEIDCEFKCTCDDGFTGQLCDTMDDSGTFKCSFENNQNCFFKNTPEGDDFDWSRNTGQTSSLGTGPAKAYRGNTYIYTEMSMPRQPGEKAILVTALNFPVEHRCLRFHYNMFGRSVDTLNVYTEGTNSSRTLVWTKSGNQGNKWLEASIDIQELEGLKILIEAIRGDDMLSDIALDEIVLQSGICVEEPKECISTLYGGDYKGRLNVTMGGKTCQAWDSQTPHAHTGNEALINDSNYCRNPHPSSSSYSPWCYTTDKNVEWEYCDISLCEPDDCRRSNNGYEYQGFVSVTKSGIPCQRWDSQKPHSHTSTGLSGHENYCRNRFSRETQPWCFTSDENVRWDFCDIPFCDTPALEFKQTFRGYEYFGSVNTTRSGKTCQRWDSKTPHSHSLGSIGDQENYCRNPDGEPEPWCYTTDPKRRWEVCDIQSYETFPCYPNPCQNGGTCIVDGTTYNCTCLKGFIGSNCETIDVMDAVEECRRSKLGFEYRGTKFTTKGGKICQRWNETFPHNHGFTSLASEENYCRNPDKEPNGPWCYTTDRYTRWDYCNIPMCTSSPKECITTSRGEDYFGTSRYTIGGQECQYWNTNSPHQHEYHYLDDQENYCRNPYNHEKAPWCYTTNPDKRWDICSIPYCSDEQ